MNNDVKQLHSLYNFSKNLNFTNILKNDVKDLNLEIIKECKKIVNSKNIDINNIIKVF